MKDGKRSGVKECPICLTVKRTEGHHVIPVSYGGPEDGRMIDVCSDCHGNLHYQAENLCSKAKRKYYFTPAQLDRATYYIKAIVTAKTISMERIAPQQIKKFIVKIENATLKKAHIRKTDMGFSSLEDYVRALIIKDVSQS